MENKKKPKMFKLNPKDAFHLSTYICIWDRYLSVTFVFYIRARHEFIELRLLVILVYQLCLGNILSLSYVQTCSLISYRYRCRCIDISRSSSNLRTS